MSPLARCMGCEQPIAAGEVLCGGSVCNTYPGIYSVELEHVSVAPELTALASSCPTPSEDPRPLRAALEAVAEVLGFLRVPEDLVELARQAGQVLEERDALQKVNGELADLSEQRRLDADHLERQVDELRQRLRDAQKPAAPAGCPALVGLARDMVSGRLTFLSQRNLERLARGYLKLAEVR